jgi:hypothetical protein
MVRAGSQRAAIPDGDRDRGPFSSRVARALAPRKMRRSEAFVPRICATDRPWHSEARRGRENGREVPRCARGAATPAPSRPRPYSAARGHSLRARWARPPTLTPDRRPVRRSARGRPSSPAAPPPTAPAARRKAPPPRSRAPRRARPCRPGSAAGARRAPARRRARRASRPGGAQSHTWGMKRTRRFRLSEGRSLGRAPRSGYAGRPPTGPAPENRRAHAPRGVAHRAHPSAFRPLAPAHPPPAQRQAPEPPGRHRRPEHLSGSCRCAPRRTGRARTADRQRARRRDRARVLARVDDRRAVATSRGEHERPQPRAHASVRGRLRRAADARNR